MTHLVLACLLVLAPAASSARQAAAPHCDVAALTPEQDARRAALMAMLRSAATSWESRPRGGVYELPGDPLVLQQIGEWIALENRCCSFLRFRVTWAGGSSPIRVRVLGPAGTGELLSRAAPETPRPGAGAQG